MDPDEILLETEAAMEKGFEYMQHEFAAVRTGKASPALVENIDVEAYGEVEGFLEGQLRHRISEETEVHGAALYHATDFRIIPAVRNRDR